MDAASAREIISATIKETFGKMTELREVSLERSSGGRVWVGNVYCVTKKGDVLVGSVGVNEDGQISRELKPDALIDALSTLENSKAPFKEMDSIEQDFSLIDDEENAPEISVKAEETEPFDLFFSEFNSSKLMANIIGLLASGEREDLLKAGRLMPQLLVDHDNRGTVLRYMGELELRLGEPRLAVEYLEAAACEFADVGDTDSLRKTAEIAARIPKEAAVDVSAMMRLLEQTLSRLVPIESLSDAKAFKDLDEIAKKRIEFAAVLEGHEEGDILLEEGSPAVKAYVIQSGILGISLETPGGGRRTVRCCFPGELVGESSVQGEGATCNATVFAQRPCTLWRFEGADLKAACRDIPDLRARLDASRAIHRLDSFFSMNNATSSLDVRVRDRLIGCISAIRNVREGEILERKGTQPSAVYLLQSCEVQYENPGALLRAYGPDEFVCLRDTLHHLPLEGDVTVSKAGRLIVFETDSLFNLASAAPPEVIAVLERLE